MLPPGAVISGFRSRLPGTPQEEKSLGTKPPGTSVTVRTWLATTILPPYRPVVSSFSEAARMLPALIIGMRTAGFLYS